MMRNTLIGLAAAGFAIIGLAGCGGAGTSTTPTTPTPTPINTTTGSSNWTAACVGAQGITAFLGFVTDAQSAGTASVGVMDSAKLLDSAGYSTLAADGRKIGTALQAGDLNGASAGLGLFNADLQATNLITCPSPTP